MSVDFGKPRQIIYQRKSCVDRHRNIGGGQRQIQGLVISPGPEAKLPHTSVPSVNLIWVLVLQDSALGSEISPDGGSFRVSRPL